MVESKGPKGLKKLRANSVDRVPRYDCDNCKCKRYSPCGCERKKVKDEPVKETV